MDIHIENEIPMCAKDLWRVMQTPEFDAFLAVSYELKEYKELEKTVTDSLIKRRVRVVTGADLSYIAWGLAGKILGGTGVVYEEIQYKYRHRYEMRWTNQWLEPTLLQGKIEVFGTMKLIPIDGEKCTRVRDLNIRISLPGLGPILERKVAEEARKTSENFSGVVEAWKARSRL